MKKTSITVASALTVAGLLALAGYSPAMASESTKKSAEATITQSGTVIAMADRRLIVAGEKGFWFFETRDDTTRPARLAAGDVVTVRYRTIGDEHVAREVIRVDQQVLVVDESLPTYHALVGRLGSASGDHLLVNTLSGEQTFVLLPRLVQRQPIPEGTHVAVLYREEERAGRNRYVATDLVEVPALPLGEPVVVRHAPIPTQADSTTRQAELDRQAELSRQQEAARGTESRRVLPQTASSSPALMLIGFLALAGGLMLRFSRSS